MNLPQTPQPAQPLLHQLLALLRGYALRWLQLLRGEPLLACFLLVNFIAFNSMVVLNVFRLRLSVGQLCLLPVVFLAIWVCFYGGLFAAMVFVAHNTPGRSEPTARRPRGELWCLLGYLWFLFIGGYLLDHGYGSALLSRALGGLMDLLNKLDTQALQTIGQSASPKSLAVLRNFHLFFTLPVLFLLACGNRPFALGFRMPLSRRWTTLVWLALPIANLAVVKTGLAHSLMAIVVAVLGPGLAEEFTFRVGLQTRLEHVLGNPVRATVASALVFALIHLNTHQPEPVWAFMNALGPKAMVGFLLGYLWYRTRSLLPIVLVHGTLDVALFTHGG